jgi:hypothetical protein
VAVPLAVNPFESARSAVNLARAVVAPVTGSKPAKVRKRARTVAEPSSKTLSSVTVPDAACVVARVPLSDSNPVPKSKLKLVPKAPWLKLR